MRTRTFAAFIAAALAASLSLPVTADAQILKKLKKAAKDAVEGEAERQIDRKVRNAVRCVFDDEECQERARKEGKEVVLTNDEGVVLMDEEGRPVTDPDAVQDVAEKPGSGAWANYDFTPGEEILFYDDYSADNVGDFPRRLEFIEGSWEVVEWQGGRYLRATANGILAIPLPRTLPERFTIEYAVNFAHGNAYVRVMPGRAYYGRARSYRGSAPSVEATQAGVRSVGEGPTALGQIKSGRVSDAMLSFRVMADGDHMKVYLGEQRVANVPNAVFPRSDTLFIALSSAAEKHPILIGPIRIAGGGADLYDRLAKDGRVTTRGILFATGSARIKPESTRTLQEIGQMLRQHTDLRVRIEGHTDSDGDDASNQELSERRAASVKQFLIENYSVDDARLESVGHGESKPVAGNETPEGKQQNRRVELVRLD